MKGLEGNKEDGYHGTLKGYTVFIHDNNFKSGQTEHLLQHKYVYRCVEGEVVPVLPGWSDKA